MLQPFDSYRLKPTLDIPEHLDEFTLLGTDLLHQAHTDGLALEWANVRVSSDDQAHRLYIESQHERPQDREGLAIHLGKACDWLMVHFQHPIAPSAIGGFEYPKSTVVLQDALAKVHTTRTFGIGPEILLSENETAGKHYTNRLHESLGYFGLDYLVERDQFRQAS